jgi:AmmeMemoRadiSam system protein B
MVAGNRPPAVAGTWYPGTAGALARQVDGYLALVETVPCGRLDAIISPHAGIMYSGPVAAHAYKAAAACGPYDAAILVGPSHYFAFDGVALYPSGAFESPLGPASIDEALGRDLRSLSSIVTERPQPHGREHSLEMQLPFVARLFAGVSIVPMVMGYQTEDTARALGDALGAVLRGKHALVIASTDLSHYHDARTAAVLDSVVIDCVSRFDPDALQHALDVQPEHACGGGPTVAVMRAARLLGAREAEILNYADSGDVSGDKSAVVGYLAAALGTFSQHAVQ